MGLNISRACEVFSLSVVRRWIYSQSAAEDGGLSLMTNKLLVLPVKEQLRVLFQFVDNSIPTTKAVLPQSLMDLPSFQP